MEWLVLLSLEFDSSYQSPENMRNLLNVVQVSNRPQLLLLFLILALAFGCP